MHGLLLPDCGEWRAYTLAVDQFQYSGILKVTHLDPVTHHPFVGRTTVTGNGLFESPARSDPIQSIDMCIASNN